MTLTYDYRHFKVRRDDDGLAWVGIDVADSALNTLGSPVLEELAQVLDYFEAGPPKVLIFYSEKESGFAAGADIEEFKALYERGDSAIGMALVRRGFDLFNRLAAVRFPTVALIRGHCLGGGLELALACHYRLAVDEPATRLGLPEVMLGILPAWGGVMRLPQLVGAPAAFDLMLTGKTIDARRAHKLGLVDMAPPPRVMWNTVRGFAHNLPEPRKLPFTQRFLTNGFVRGVVANQARKQVAARARPEHYPAPYAIIDLWYKYDGDIRETSAYESGSMQALLEHPTARNLLRVFGLREQLKAQAKGIDYRARHVHVVGAGVMGGDIAAWCALRGLTVTLQDLDAARIAPAIGRAAALFKKRLRDPRRIRDAMDRLIPDPRGAGAARADVIIEAIVEDLAIKQQVFQELEARARPDALLASNTSSIPLAQIASALRDPGRLLGIHFFNPVAQMMLVEVIRDEATRPELVERALAFVRQIDKLPLNCKSAPGFWVNRILTPYLAEALQCADEGIPLEQIDEAALAFGMPMGPIELADVVGLDVCRAVGQIVTPERPEPVKLRAKLDAKLYGKKSGQGFYVWKDGKPQKEPADKAPDELVTRLITPLLNEANQALAEGVVSAADLADAGAIFGCGFAPFTGGPIHYQRQEMARLAY